MSAIENKPPPDYDEEFEQAVNQWRERHKLREDDAVLMLVELFRIHQRHWDAFRRAENPQLDQLRTELSAAGVLSQRLQQQIGAITEILKKFPAPPVPERISVASATFAVIAAILGGYLIGRAWP